MKDSNIKYITTLRFPLTVGVLFIHSLYLSSGSYPIYDFTYFLITNILCGVCVPLFFFFSGYLFFSNVKQFSMSVYKDKLKRRFKSLFIPYIFWNFFFIAVIGLGQLIIPSAFSGSFKPLSSFSFSEWISLFYCAMDSNKPIAFQMWFIRDLMCVTLLTPFIYYLCKWLSFWWLLLPFVAYILHIPGVLYGFSFWAIAFFSTGCYFGMNKLSFTFSSTQARVISIAVYLAMIVVEFLIKDLNYYGHIHCINVIIGCVAMIQFMSFFLKDNNLTQSLRLPESIDRSSFYIYCYHGVFVAFIASRVASDYVYNDLTAVGWYFLIVLVLLFIGVLSFNVLLKLFPNFTRFVTGSRV